MKDRKKTSPIWDMDVNKLQELVTASRTLKEILSAFGIAGKGGNYSTLKKRLIQDGIDYSHITLGTGHNKGKTQIRSKIPLADVMVQNSGYSRSSLKKRLVRTGVLENKCSICGLDDDWESKPIVMILDHINGVSDDHRLENLRMVCPNCNSQLSTHCGKHKKRRVQNCEACGVVLDSKRKYCDSCHDIAIHNPMKDLPITKDDLYELLKSTTFEAVGAKFDVSGNSIKKWCKRYSIPHLANHYRQYKEHVNSCVDCGCEIPNRQERCNLCFRKHAGYKDTPSKAELLEMSKAKNNFQLSKVYGVSNHTIARWKSKYNL